MHFATQGEIVSSIYFFTLVFSLTWAQINYLLLLLQKVLLIRVVRKPKIKQKNPTKIQN